jgi:hypothetical protein
MELIIRALGEETATGLHQKNESQGYVQIEQDVKEAGDTAADARRAVEKRLGEPVVSAQNFLESPKRKPKQLSASTQPTLFDLPDDAVSAGEDWTEPL